jgi:chromosome partitioning protein
MESVSIAATYVPKGGVSKTTNTGHMAVAADTTHDLDVLLIDLAGRQNDLAKQFGLYDQLYDDKAEQVDPDAPISAVFSDDWAFIRDNIDDVVDRMVYPTGEGPDLIPADPGLSGADNNLASVRVEDRYVKLAEFIREDIAPRYDLILMDLPGNENNIVLNGLFAAGSVVAPLSPGKFERDQLQSLDTALEGIRSEHDIGVHLAMVIPSVISRGTTMGREFPDWVRDEYPEAVAPEPVPKSQNVPNQQGEGRTIFAVDDEELYDTGRRARRAYEANAGALVERLGVVANV